MTPIDTAAQVLSKSDAAKGIGIHGSNNCHDHPRLGKLFKTLDRTLAENKITADSVAMNATVFSGQTIGVNDSVYAEMQFFKGSDNIRTEVTVSKGSCGEASES